MNSAQFACDLVEAAGADPVLAGLVFLYLLELDTDPLGELVLAQRQGPAALAQALADMNVHRMRHTHLQATERPGTSPMVEIQYGTIVSLNNR